MADTDGTPRRLSTASWIVYDMANTIFSFAIVTSFYPLWLTGDLGLRDSVFAVGSSASMAVMLLLAPVLGALSDRARRRIPFLAVSTLVCVLATAPLGLVDWRLSLGFFLVANVGFQSGLIFYDSLLPAVSTPRTRGRVGALGVGVGYLGSLVALALGGAILAGHETRDAAVFAAAAGAFLVLAVPAFLFVREPVRGGGPVRPPDLARAARAGFAGLARVLAGREHPRVRRFLVGRVFYTDAANTMIAFMAIYATREAGFSDAGVRGVLLMGILGAAACAPLWGLLVDRAGPKHALDAVLLTWMFGLVMVILVPLLDLPAAVFYPLAFLLGGALGGTWSADRPLMLGLAPPERLGEFYGYYAMVGRFSAIAGPLVWALVVDGLGWGRPAAVASLLGFMVVGYAILRRLPDPDRPGAHFLGAYLPWRAVDGSPLPPPPRRWARFPATAVYLVATTALFLWGLAAYGRGQDWVIDVGRVPAALRWVFVFEIPALFADPARTVVNFAAGVWVNYHYVQLIYVWVLLLLFGAWFEVREGTRRAVAIFYGTSIVAGLFAGALLHVLRALSDAAWIDDTWGRAWTGGSAGAFGLMGALAARARKPWLLLGAFAVWEANVEFWYLRSYTPAFHLPALAAGFLLARYVVRPRPAPGRAPRRLAGAAG